jgi:hypothetical protein
MTFLTLEVNSLVLLKIQVFWDVIAGLVGKYFLTFQRIVEENSSLVDLP